MTTARVLKAETPYLRIKRAALAGHSVLLRPHECATLYKEDAAIRDRADLDDLERQAEIEALPGKKRAKRPRGYNI